MVIGGRFTTRTPNWFPLQGWLLSPSCEHKGTQKLSTERYREPHNCHRQKVGSDNCQGQKSSENRHCNRTARVWQRSGSDDCQWQTSQTTMEPHDCQRQKCGSDNCQRQKSQTLFLKLRLQWSHTIANGKSVAQTVANGKSLRH